MSAEYHPQQFSDLFDTDLGREIWSFLNQRENVLRMETATYLGRPAVEALSPNLHERFAEAAFSDRMKRMIGHMVRQILESRGYQLDRTGVRITTVGNGFGSGARYVLR